MGTWPFFKRGEEENMLIALAYAFSSRLRASAPLRLFFGATSSRFAGILREEQPCLREAVDACDDASGGSERCARAF